MDVETGADTKKIRQPINTMRKLQETIIVNWLKAELTEIGSFAPRYMVLQQKSAPQIQ